MRRVFAKGVRRKAPGSMNKTEARYSALLAERVAKGEVERFRYEALKLRLAVNTHYTPDFLVLLTDGTMELHEVKGGFIHDDGSRIKLKVAASLFPEFVFRQATYRNKAEGWVVEEVEPEAGERDQSAGELF